MNEDKENVNVMFKWQRELVKKVIFGDALDITEIDEQAEYPFDDGYKCTLF